MLNQFDISGRNKNYSLALVMGLGVGLATILYVLFIGQDHNKVVYAFAEFIGKTGNDAFLWLTNLYLILWAFRNNLKSSISLTLWLNFVIGVSIQGTKFLALGIQMIGWAAIPWTLRPNGVPGGFPSGHAAHAFAMAFLLTCYFPRWTWFWYACAAAISWSRLETSDHTVLQIIAGIIFGLLAISVMMNRWLKHNNMLQKDGLAAEKAKPAPVMVQAS